MSAKPAPLSCCVQQLLCAALHVRVERQDQVSTVLRFAQHLAAHDLAAPILDQSPFAAQAMQMRVVLQLETTAPDAVSRSIVAQFSTLSLERFVEPILFRRLCLASRRAMIS